MSKRGSWFAQQDDPSTFEVMVRQFCDLKVHTDPKLLPIITTLIFEKAVEDQMFCPLYSDLCLKQTKKKRTLLGIIQFIAQLYRYNLLIDWIINWCVVELFKRYDKTTDEVYIEYAVKMIETKQSMAAAADAEVPYIEKIVAQLCSIKSSLTNKLKFMIMNLDELRKNNWQTKHDSRRLTTLENREDDTEQEERQNKKDRSTDRRAADAGASSQTGTASVREGTNLIKVNDGRLGRLPNIWKSYGAVPTASVTSPSNADSTTKKHHLHTSFNAFSSTPRIKETNWLIGTGSSSSREVLMAWLRTSGLIIECQS
uniref:MIF4G domain-containing protein n=1 Tax=Ditylenchus dipsaci TaxID=166011 RepID=A0A915ELA6_9BILA